MYLISPNTPQHKANLHCHSVHSDGALTPTELKNAYRERGYSILAITDHETPQAHNELTDEHFLMLTGYEVYIRPSQQCVYDVFSPEIHMNLFARDPQNETLVGYNPPYCKYLPAERQETIEKAGPLRPREYTVEYINEFIQAAREAGYLVAYNHPVWSMESEERILAYDGIFSLELINGGSDVISGMEYSGALYDKLIRSGKRWFVHAGDDNHNHDPLDSVDSDSFRAATTILTEKLSYDAVIKAMETGEMYSTSGPVIREVSVEGDEVTVVCSDAVYIGCHIGSKRPEYVRGTNQNPVTTATFRIHPKAQYLRISVIDADGGRADTRAYFREEWNQ